MGDFCQRCYDRELAKVKAKSGGGSVRVPKEQFKGKCKIPIYQSDYMGNPQVRMWDCEKEDWIVISAFEYDRRRREGKL